MVDGVQTDSSGSHEKSNPLQLSVANIVLEDNIIGEVHTADLLQSLRALAEWDPTLLLGVGLVSSGLGGNGALEVLHPEQLISLLLKNW